MCWGTSGLMSPLLGHGLRLCSWAVSLGQWVPLMPTLPLQDDLPSLRPDCVTCGHRGQWLLLARCLWS